MEEEEEEMDSVWTADVGTVLKVMKPMRMTTSETRYSPENWGKKKGRMQI